MSKIKNEFTITRQEILDENNLAGHIILDSIGRIQDKQILKLIGKKQNEFECYIVFQGKKLPIQPFCEHWAKQVDEMIRKKALELLDLETKGLNRLYDTICEIENQIKIRVKDMLDIEVEE